MPLPTARSICCRARKWDAETVRDDLRDYVVDAFVDPGAILVVDESGDVNKGVHSVGVQRQYTGTAGRIEKAQVAACLTYTAPRGHIASHLARPGRRGGSMLAYQGILPSCQRAHRH
jgi:SRSO17 transposase